MQYSTDMMNTNMVQLYGNRAKHIRTAYESANHGKLPVQALDTAPYPAWSNRISQVLILDDTTRISFGGDCPFGHADCRS